MSKVFNKKLISWIKEPTASPDETICALKHNDITYSFDILNTNCPIDYFKKVFLPNHLYWFLMDPDYLNQLSNAQAEKDPRKYFRNLLLPTLKLELIETQLHNYLLKYIESKDPKTKDTIIQLLLAEFKYEIKRVAYNSQVKDFVRGYISNLNISMEDKGILLMPSYGTIYSYLALQSYNHNISYLAKHFFGGSIEDAKSRINNLTEINRKSSLEEEVQDLKRIKVRKTELQKIYPEIEYLDGLITFDKLIDKLIVYSGLLRHSAIAKYILLEKSNLSEVDIFKIHTKEIPQYI